MEFETVIGLEIHAQMKTKSKIFCGCSTEFGAPPNTHVCPVCLGMPGVLPVLNRQVVENGIKLALATDLAINRENRFARKNYFYPDLPKGYQISQFELPIAEHGKVDIEVINDGAFYGSLELPYHCDEIGTPQYMYTLKGFHDEKLVGETQLTFIGGSGARSTMLCRTKDESEGVARGVASCLLVVVDKDTEGTALADIIVDALDGYKMPPLNTVTLGQFAFYYYYPKYDEAEFTLWELEGEFNDDWQSSAKFLGRTRVANNQPEPTGL